MSDDIQRLPPRTAVVCDGCGNKVYFAVIQTKPCADGTHCIAYGECPLCGHRSTQTVEIAPKGRRKRHAIVGGEAF